MLLIPSRWKANIWHLQVLKKDYVAAGLCCIQLFLNSSNHELALRHLEHAKVFNLLESVDAGTELGLKFLQYYFVLDT